MLMLVSVLLNMHGNSFKDIYFSADTKPRKDIYFSADTKPSQQMQNAFCICCENS